MRRALIAVFAMVSIAGPVHADEERAPAASAFGNEWLADWGEELAPAPLDLDITRDGDFFWRGQLEGNGQKVTVYEGRPTLCDQLFISGTVANPELLEKPQPTRLALQISPVSRDQPDRFRMDFSYHKDFDVGDLCQKGIDRRTQSARYTFVLREGESLVLPRSGPFELTVSRK